MAAYLSSGSWSDNLNMDILVTIGPGLDLLCSSRKTYFDVLRLDSGNWTFANGDKVAKTLRVRIQEGAGAILWPLISMLWV